MTQSHKGWQCPVCNRVYAPFVASCHSCNQQVERGSSETIHIDGVVSLDRCFPFSTDGFGGSGGATGVATTGRKWWIQYG